MIWLHRNIVTVLVIVVALVAEAALLLIRGIA